jgi:hypothetical protein
MGKMGLQSLIRSLTNVVPSLERNKMKNNKEYQIVGTVPRST